MINRIMYPYLCAQGPAVHGALGRALLAGGAALQPDERTAEPHRGQNVFATKRPSAASASPAPTRRDQAPLGDQVGKEHSTQKNGGLIITWHARWNVSKTM